MSKFDDNLNKGIQISQEFLRKQKPGFSITISDLVVVLAKQGLFLSTHAVTMMLKKLEADGTVVRPTKRTISVPMPTAAGAAAPNDFNDRLTKLEARLAALEGRLL